MLDYSLIPPINLLNSVNFFGELTEFIGLTDICQAKLSDLHNCKLDDLRAGFEIAEEYWSGHG